MIKIIYFTTALSFCLLSFGIRAQSPADTLAYDIYIGKELVGNLIASRIVQADSSIQYAVKSYVDYRILFSFHISFDYLENISPKGKYNYSKFKYMMNDDVKEENWVKCETKDCYVYENDEIEKVISLPAGLTAIQLYFHEPSYGEEVFSERFCEYYEVEKDADSYKIDFPGGSSNHYYYKNGLCHRILIKTLVSDMEFKIRNYDALVLKGK